jgi:hypothetical protein
MLGCHAFTGGKVRRNIFSDGGVRTPACLNGLDAVWFERGVPEEEFAVFLGEDVVGDLFGWREVRVGWWERMRIERWVECRLV